MPIMFAHGYMYNIYKQLYLYTDPVPDPCLSNPCDPNADCTRDGPQSTTFTCTCTPPFEAVGMTCEGELIFI